MKLRFKLVSIWFTIAFFIVILGGVNIHSQNLLYQQLNQNFRDINPKIIALEKIKEAFFKMKDSAYLSAIYQNLSSDNQLILSPRDAQVKFDLSRHELEKSIKKFKQEFPQEYYQINLQLIEKNTQEIEIILEELIKLKYADNKRENVVFFRDSLEQAERKFIWAVNQAIDGKRKQLQQQEKLDVDKAARVTLISSVAGSFAALLAGLFGIILAEKIVRPLEKIKEASLLLGQGKLDTRINLKDNSEIRFLATAFNQMADNLKKVTVSQVYVDNILRSMIDPLIILNRDTTIKNFNLATFLLLGYHEEKELVGQPMKVLFEDESFLQDLENDEFTHKNSFLGRKETCLITKNGGKIPVYFSASVMKNEQGEVEGFVCLAQDISDRKRAEAARQESEAKWRSLVENAPDLIVTADATGQIQFVNRPAAKVSTKDVIGSSVYDWVLPEYQPQLKQLLEKVINTGLPQYCEMPGFVRDGSITWYASRLGPIFHNGQAVAVTMITTDIGERKRMEEALRESEERLEGILNSLKDIVWSTAADNFKPLYLNPAAETIYGRPINEFFYNPCLWLEVVHPEDLPSVSSFLENVLQTGSVEMEYRICRPDGEVRWLHNRALLTRDADGVPIRIDGIASDITQRMLSEEALLKAKEDLELRVQERTKAIKQTNKRLQREIAERQVVAEALRQSEERLNGILNSLDDIVWSIDPDTLQPFYLSPAIARIYDRPLAEFFQDTQLWLSMILPEDQPEIERSIQTTLQIGFSEVEYRIKRADGELRSLRSRARLVLDSDGNRLRIDGIATDITARKEAEAALRQSEARYKKLARREALLNDLASQIRNSLDLDTILATAVREIRNLLQIDRCLFVWYRPNSSGEAISTFNSSPVGELSVSASPYWEVVKEAHDPTLSSFLGNYPHCQDNPYIAQLLNLEIIRVNDTSQNPESCQQEFGCIWFYTSVTMLPIQTLSGEIGVLSCGHHSGARFWRDSEVALLRAIADQLGIAISQAELYAHATEAARSAKQQAQQLQSAMKALQQTQAQLIQTEKMSSLGQMVAGIAHEINNPVSFIYGNVDPAIQYIEDLLHLLELYQESYQPTEEIVEEIEAIELDFLKEDLPKLLSSMKVGADRIRQIVLSLRNFSRLDEAQMKEVNLHEGIDNTLLILQNRLKAKGEKREIKILKDYGNLPMVECFVGQLNQVFMNIIANAIDALEFYRVQEDLLASSPTIVIRTGLLNSQAVEICISDNGPGMNEQVKQRIFDPFFTTKPVGSGTGLGLSISYQIVVDKHKGEIRCVSIPGKGTEFIIELPVHQDYAEPAIFA